MGTRQKTCHPLQRYHSSGRQLSDMMCCWRSSTACFWPYLFGTPLANLPRARPNLLLICSRKRSCFLFGLASKRCCHRWTGAVTVEPSIIGVDVTILSQVWVQIRQTDRGKQKISSSRNGPQNAIEAHMHILQYIQGVRKLSYQSMEDWLWRKFIKWNK